MVLRSALDSTPPLLFSSHYRLSFSFSLFRYLSFSSTCLSFSLPLYLPHSLCMFITLYLLSSSSLLFCSLSLSVSVCFFLFISLTLYMMPSFSLCHLFFSIPLHPSLPLLHIFSLFLSFFACLRHSDNSATKLAIPQIVTASYRTIDFSQYFCFSKISKISSRFDPSASLVRLFNFQKIFIRLCDTELLIYSFIHELYIISIRNKDFIFVKKKKKKVLKNFLNYFRDSEDTEFIMFRRINLYQFLSFHLLQCK